MREAVINIDGQMIVIAVEGKTIFGKKKVLLLEDDDLSKNTDWHEAGYTIAPFLSFELFEKIKKGVEDIIRIFIEKEIGRPIPNFTLEKYYLFCNTNDLHLAVVRHFQKCLNSNDFPINYGLVEKRVSEICGVQVVSHPPDLPISGKFCIRIVRPQKDSDNNPPHRDVWLDRLRNAVNIYLPLAGSNAQSSLPLIPGSHFWSESDIERTEVGGKVNNVAFTVPCVVNSTHGLNMTRPLPAKNEVMVFSPYLIHGGGCNLNEDETRVSLEMRFWRKATDGPPAKNSTDLDNLNQPKC